ncbi:hypothetical protein HU200_047844 [Digitaria exilis]|uniref:Cytochrome P450 n=1 Tax=Digitaria exilis TaxID=1010633 RepID=A0A835AWC3_9POAL|nr:hypothetical protein HU200_047844 [Digitaria exilis]
MNDYFYQSLLLSLAALVKFALSPRAQLPPGPWKLPVIGSMHHLVNVLPHLKLRDLAAVHGPLMMLRLGQTPLVVASSKETARAVLKTHDTNFATRPKLLAGEILRQLCSAEILSPKRVLSFRHIREDEVSAAISVALKLEEIRAVGPSAPVNLTVMFQSLTNSIVSRAAFGKKRKNAPDGFNIPDLFPTWTTLLAKVTGMKRKPPGHPQDGGLHPAGDHRREEGHPDEKLKAAPERRGRTSSTCSSAFRGKAASDMSPVGTGTSASAMEWGMSELMRNPAVMKKLQGQIREAFQGKAEVTEADLQSSNSETLRLHLPAPLAGATGGHRGVRARRLHHPGQVTRRGQLRSPSQGPQVLGRSRGVKPEQFEDGGIDFMGSSYEFLPFGSGRRMCPALTMGSPAWSRAGCDALPLRLGVDMEEAPGLGVRRRSPLMFCATPLRSAGHNSPRCMIHTHVMQQALVLATCPPCNPMHDPATNKARQT